MARKHARLLLSIWDDDDFTRLTPVDQSIYFGIISSRDLSWCGVAPLLPQRLVRNAQGLTERRVAAALDRLARDRFVVIDRDTAELVVRTFVRHDEVMRQPNVVKAMATALDRVHSRRLRDVILEEVARDFVEHPEYPGWRALADHYPKVMAEVHEKASGNPSANPSRKAR